MKLVLKDNGDYAFSGRAVKITEEKNKACAEYGKQVLNLSFLPERQDERLYL